MASLVIVSLYYDEKGAGIARYSSQLAKYLCDENDVSITAIVAPPHYPWWRIQGGPQRWWRRTRVSSRLTTVACPILLPAGGRLTPTWRMLYEASFFLSSLPPILSSLFGPTRSDSVLVVVPSLLSAVVPVAASRFTGTPVVVHIQDMQVDAAAQLGILRHSLVLRLLKGVEAYVLRNASVVSSISSSMVRSLEKRRGKDDVVLLQNWADDESFFEPSGDAVRDYRREWRLGNDTKLFLYSGNIGEKQGIELIVDVASRLSSRKDIQFVICGDGAAKHALVRKAMEVGADNVLFAPFQPREHLNALLRSADCHIITQRPEATDLVMPSKLANILAVGGLTIATAERESELRAVLAEGDKRGLVVPPNDVDAMTETVLSVADNPRKYRDVQARARQFAMTHLRLAPVANEFSRILQVQGPGDNGRSTVPGAQTHRE